MRSSRSRVSARTCSTSTSAGCRGSRSAWGEQTRLHAGGGRTRRHGYGRLREALHGAADLRTTIGPTRPPCAGAPARWRSWPTSWLRPNELTEALEEVRNRLRAGPPEVLHPARRVLQPRGHHRVAGDSERRRHLPGAAGRTARRDTSGTSSTADEDWYDINEMIELIVERVMAAGQGRQPQGQTARPRWMRSSGHVVGRRSTPI
jgi:hypothetical protein